MPSCKRVTLDVGWSTFRLQELSAANDERRSVLDRKPAWVDAGAREYYAPAELFTMTRADGMRVTCGFHLWRGISQDFAGQLMVFMVPIHGVDPRMELSVDDPTRFFTDDQAYRRLNEESTANAYLIIDTSQEASAGPVVAWLIIDHEDGLRAFTKEDAMTVNAAIGRVVAYFRSPAMVS